MTNQEIDNFIKKYGGKNINFYIDNKRSTYCAAMTFYFGKDKNTNKKIYVIILKKKIFHNKELPKAYLEAMILHEIGHIKKNHFTRKISKSTAEFEAQLWALTKAIKYNLKFIKCYLIEIFLGWKSLNKYKNKKYYYYAYKKFYKIVGKRSINKWCKVIIKISSNQLIK
jgi:hypothetical protein